MKIVYTRLLTNQISISSSSSSLLRCIIFNNLYLSIVYLDFRIKIEKKFIKVDASFSIVKFIEFKGNNSFPDR
ncbi:hypothetical protein DERP_002177 [Dermatophagoides pteronyssinus]|uniref:Uncharacterized protein n=1 Tax=Dermatophagoides pteronyssinus TaxID=6956 RepID=A0ABQ8JHH3_DERPT|nr:hypothetical protein DERP_002177 [Dermatophagoides pteronyssinus]